MSKIRSLSAVLSDDNTAYNQVIEMSTTALSALDDSLQALLESVGAGKGVKLYWRHVGIAGDTLDYIVSVKQEIAENGNVGYRAQFVEGGVSALELGATLAVSSLLGPAIAASGIGIAGTVVVAVGVDYAVSTVFDREATVGKEVRDMLREGYNGYFHAETISPSELQPNKARVVISGSNTQIGINLNQGQTTVTYTPDPSSALIPTTQDIIDAIIPIKQSPIPNNPFFVHPEVNITLPSGRSRAYIGTDAAEAFNLIPGSQTAEGGTIVYTLGGDDEVGINGGNNYIDGGNGTDTVSYSSATPDTQGVPLSVIVGSSGRKNATAIVERTINPEQNTDTLVNIEKIIGTSKDDTFTLTEFIPNLTLEGGLGDDTLSWETMTGFPSVNVQYDKMQLSRAYVDDGFEYYYSEGSGDWYYSDDFTDKENPNTITMRISGFEAFQGVGLYMLGKSYGSPYSYNIQASSPIAADYRYSDYAIRADLSGRTIETLDDEGKVIATDTVPAVSDIYGTPYADYFSGTPYTNSDTGNRDVWLFGREGDNVYSFLTRDNTHYHIDSQQVGVCQYANDNNFYKAFVRYAA